MNRTNGNIKSGQSKEDLQMRLQTLSALASRVSLGYKMGFSHQGERNIRETLGYPTKITSSDLISRWKRQDIARAIVDRPVKATWQGVLSIQEPEIEDETELEKTFNKLEQQLHLKRVFMRVDRLAQLGKYAVILLGFDDSSNETWGRPVSEGKRELKYLKVLSEKNADISTWEKDTTNSRYGMPRLYNIKLKHPGEDEKTTSIKVHHSRIIHVTPDLLENEVEGHSIFETAYNRLMDLEKLVGGSAEMFWRGARPGYAGKADPDFKVDADTEEKMREQLNEYENDLRRFLMMEGVDVESLAQQIADPKGHVDVQIQMLSALTNIPARILMGSERGELASSEDANNWKEYIHNRRLENAEPNIVRPFIERMVTTGVLPGPRNEEIGYSVSWPDLFSLGEKDKAEIGAKRSNALSSFAREPMAEQLVPLEGFLRYVLRMDDDEVSHILKMQENQIDDLIEEENELETEAQSTRSRQGADGAEPSD